MRPLVDKWRELLNGAATLAPSDARAASNEVRAFAFDFYHHLDSDKPDNLIFSPFSIWLALMMVYAGARAKTATQMQRVLHLPAAENDLHAQAAALIAEIMRRQLDPADEDYPELNIANRLWGQIGLPFDPAYLDLVAKFYASDLAQTDFQGGSLEKIVAEINAWVAEQTRDKIPQIISPALLDPFTRLVLVNAVYFKGLWQFPFSEYATHDAPFHLLEGGTTTVRMMSQKESLENVILKDYAAVHLPYRGGGLAMLLILPAEGRFLELERRFDGAMFQTLLRSQSYEKIELYLPRFELNTSLMLKDALAKLGMSDAFDAAAADFSGMAVVPKEENLYISAGVHRAYIKVDETGTEAAAATAVMMRARGMMIEKRPPVIRFDRPFLYAIYDKPTGTILFMGRVMNPAE